MLAISVTSDITPLNLSYHICIDDSLIKSVIENLSYATTAGEIELNMFQWTVKVRMTNDRVIVYASSVYYATTVGCRPHFRA